MAKISYGWPKKEHECAFFQNDCIKNEKQISNHSYLVYTIDVSVILSEARRA